MNIHLVTLMLLVTLMSLNGCATVQPQQAEYVRENRNCRTIQVSEFETIHDCDVDKTQDEYSSADLILTEILLQTTFEFLFNVILNTHYSSHGNKPRGSHSFKSRAR